MGGIYYADKCLFCPTVYMLLADPGAPNQVPCASHLGPLVLVS